MVKMQDILKEVLRQIRPGEKERERFRETKDQLLEKAKQAISEFNLAVQPKIVGSTGRGTWLSGAHDIDLFLLFPEDTPRERLEEMGLELGKKISDGRGREQYAEHPYVNTEMDGFDVDIVPCYDLDDPTQIRSAVDRSPHHQRYIKNRLTSDKTDQVLLLKKFMKGIGAYGSELETQGFSGYLCELLVIHTGSFLDVIKSASEWNSKKIINKSNDRSREDLMKMFPDKPLIFVDPVDPGRNVAAAVSKKNYAKFIRASQSFLRNPKKEFFFPKKPPESKQDLKEIIKKRESRLLMIVTEIPYDLVPDIIYPQLRKTEKTLNRKLEKDKFEVLRSAVWTDEEKAILLFELEVSKVSKTRKHTGPPIDVESEPFVQKHMNSDEKLAGPYLNEEGRLIFELKRENTEAREVLEDALKSREGFGKHVKKSLKDKGYEIVENENTVNRAHEMDAMDFLGDYLTKSLPWYR